MFPSRCFLVSICTALVCLAWSFGYADIDGSDSEVMPSTGTSGLLEGVTLGSERGSDFLPKADNLSGHVSTYTGQFVYNLPILSLDGRGGSKLTFSIHYSSAESRKKATLPNRYYQASWVGLGWQGGFGYITSDRNSTSTIADDKYTLVDESGATHNLVEDPESPGYYHPGRHKNWEILRILDTGGDVENWRVEHEDGRVFIYGTSHGSPATMCNVRVGQNAADPQGWVGAGTYGDRNPYRWNLSAITDTDGDNAFIFWYSWETAGLINNGVASIYYDRATYLERVFAPDGHYLEFTMGGRNDLEQVWDDWHHDFYMGKKLGRVSLRTADDQIIEEVNFGYDYLNRRSDSTHQKLILRKVSRVSGIDPNLGPPVHLFTYEKTDPAAGHFGAITKVVEPSGTIKEISYVTDDDNSWTQLSLLDTTSVRESSGDASADWHASTMTDRISVFTWLYGLTMYCKVSYWNGSWHSLDDAVGPMPKRRNVRFGAGGDFAVILKPIEPESGPDSLYVLRLVDGYLSSSRLLAPAEIDPDDTVSIKCGVNSFVLTRHSGNAQTASNREEVPLVWSYHWNGNQWLSHEVLGMDTLEVANQWFDDEVLVGASSVLARRRMVADDFHAVNGEMLTFGIWHNGEFYADTVFEDTLYTCAASSGPPVDPFEVVAIHPPYAAYLHHQQYDDDSAYIVVHEFDYTDSWSEGTIIPGSNIRFDRCYPGEGHASWLRITDDFIAWASVDPAGLRTLEVVRKEGENWGSIESIPLYEVVSQSYSDWAYPLEQVTSHSIVTLWKHLPTDPNDKEIYINVYEWNGAQWQEQEIWRTAGWPCPYPYLADSPRAFAAPNLNLVATDHIISVHRRDTIPGWNPLYDRTWVSTYDGRAGSGNWSNMHVQPSGIHSTQFTENLSGYGALDFDLQVVEDRILVYGRRNQVVEPLVGHELNLFEFDRDRNGWDTSAISLDYLQDSSLAQGEISLTRNNLSFAVQNGGSNAAGFSRRDDVLYRMAHSNLGLEEGLAQQTLVDTIRVKQSENDSDPTIISCSFDEVRKDVTDNYPRAGKATISAPYKISDPVFNTYYYQYNDSATDRTPDLNSEAIFGIEGGGHFLDGRAFMIEYETASGIDFDSSLFTVADLDNTVYRTYLIRSVTSKDGFVTHSDFNNVMTYDGPGLRDCFQVRSNYYNYAGRDGLAIVEIDSVVYGHEVSSGMTNSNSFIQPYKIFRKHAHKASGQPWQYEDLSTKTLDYIKEARYQVDQSTIDVDNPSTQILTMSVTGWDDYGNAVSFLDANSIERGLVYDSDSMKVIAEIANATPDDVVLMDFEHGSLGRVHLPPPSSAASSVEAPVFTGDSSYYIAGPAGLEQEGPRSALATDAGVWKDSLYQVTVWAKGDFRGFVYLKAWCTYSGGDGAFEFPLTIDPDPNSWQYYSSIINVDTLIELYPSATSMDSLSVRLVRAGVDGQSNPATVDNYIIYDDLRVIPYSSSVTTRSFDQVTGMVLSESDNNNVPVKYEYDGLRRLIVTRNYADELIETREYFYAMDSVAVAVDEYYEIPTWNLYAGPVFLVRHAGWVKYEYVVDLDDCNCSWVAPDFNLQTQNCQDVTIGPGVAGCQQGEIIEIDSIYYSEPCIIEVYDQYGAGTDCTEPYAVATLTLHMDEYYNEEWPNHVKTTRYSSPTDSVESMTIYDRLGQAVQTRSYHDIDGEDTLTVVAGTGYDARGRVVKAYKPYLDYEPDNAVNLFDPLSTFLEEVNKYYDGGLVDTTVRAYVAGSGSDISFDTVLSDQTVSYHLRVPNPAWCVNSYARIWRNASLIHELDCSPGGTYSSSFQANAGDSVTVEVYSDAVEPDVFTRAIFTHRVLGPDAGIPDCLGYPYTEFVYEQGVLNRLDETKPPGNFKDDGVTVSYGVTSSPLDGFAAGDLFEQITEDENDIGRASYTDALGMVIATVADTLGDSGGTMPAHTSHYPNFQGLDTLIIQPEGQNIYREYNNLGWLLKDSAGDYGRARHMYDRGGTLRFSMTATDSVANQFHYYKYDRLNRLVEEGKVVGDISLLCWDSAIIREFPDITRPSNYTLIKTSEFVYDQGQFGLGRLAKATRYASGHSDSASWEEYTYDAFGRVTEKKQHVHVLDAGTSTRDTQVEYNNLGQTTRITYNTGGYVDYQFDRAGRVSQVEDDSSILRAQFEYWPTGQTKTKTLGYEPAQVVDYQYNARDWLVSINDGYAYSQTSGAVDHFGLLLKYTEGAYQPTGGQFPTGYYNGNIASYSAVVSTGSDEPDTTLQSYAYDALDRLTGEWIQGDHAPPGPAREQLFTFDRNGNILQATRSGGLGEQYNYYSGTNRVKCIGYFGGNCVEDENFLYTPAGSMTKYEEEDIDMAYNNHEQLARRVMDGSLYRDTVRFWYNTSGQRIAKKFNYYWMSHCWVEGDTTGTEEDFLGGGLLIPIVDPATGDTTWIPMFTDSLGDSLGFGGGEAYAPPPGGGHWEPCPKKDSSRTAFYYLGDKLIFDYKSYGSGSVLIGNYVYANGERVAKFEGSSTYAVQYYLTDHLGSVVATVDHDGDLKVHNLYLPWGEKISSYVAGNADNQFQYTSQYQDEELSRELAYYGARYYDQKLKIFTSVDPLGAKYPSWGSFIYCKNNPITVIDPDGLDDIFVSGLTQPRPEETFRDMIPVIKLHTAVWNDFYVLGGEPLLYVFASSDYVRFMRGAQWFNDNKGEIDINQPLNIWTHSQGGWFGEGIATAADAAEYNVSITHLEFYVNPLEEYVSPLGGPMSGVADITGTRTYVWGSRLPFTQGPRSDGAREFYVPQTSWYLEPWLYLSPFWNIADMVSSHMSIKSEETAWMLYDYYGPPAPYADDNIWYQQDGSSRYYSE